MYFMHLLPDVSARRFRDPQKSDAKSMMDQVAVVCRTLAAGECKDIPLLFTILIP